MRERGADDNSNTTLANGFVVQVLQVAGIHWTTDEGAALCVCGSKRF